VRWGSFQPRCQFTAEFHTYETNSFIRTLAVPLVHFSITRFMSTQFLNTLDNLEKYFEVWIYYLFICYLESWLIKLVINCSFRKTKEL
jgi:hypothetical protein